MLTFKFLLASFTLLHAGTVAVWDVCFLWDDVGRATMWYDAVPRRARARREPVTIHGVVRRRIGSA